MMRRFLAWALMFGAVLSAAACSREGGDQSRAQTHKARLGGTLVKLGDHAAHIEFVHNAVSGDLTAHVVDSHAATRVRLAQETISLHLISRAGDDATGQLVLGAVDDPALGEKRGDASQFAAASEFLRRRSRFTVVLTQIEVAGEAFRDVSFPFPEGNESAHDVAGE